ncbi:hypothetical protein OC846_001598 [Tilletia horrida]|uniref:RWD domain-containing protein n=1 Tax=Tilletia horrida TaxID=155126 RepID=A0AAN6GSH0_9BASI|nr:hypothetical protein OC845_002144 [Tilletia horrida]KAK0555727.1 hypothetical protein OC846_001598 [Tilletia horrida]
MTLNELVLQIRTDAHQGSSVDLEALAEELEALNAIFTTEMRGLDSGGAAAAAEAVEDDDQAETNGPVPGGIYVSQVESMSEGTTTAEPEEVPIRLSITIPPSYPSSASAPSLSAADNKPPQLQLLNRFVGPYPVDASLFGSILRTFLHYDPASAPTVAASTSSNKTDIELASSPSDERPLTPRHDHGPSRHGVRWQPGEPVLYEGIEYVRELVTDWYSQHSRRDRERTNARDRSAAKKLGEHVEEEEDEPAAAITAPSRPLSSPASQQVKSAILQRLVRTEPITERKSAFIAHAARLDHPDEVPIVLSHIMSDRKIARATHPIIHAWVCTTDVVHRDHDDDGETAAGGRLAHLLDLLGLQNAIVVVTRWYGGILLGADRFKFINRVARSGLEQAKLIES